MDRAELSAWLRLTLAPGVGNETARALLAAFGLPEAIFRQSTDALQQVVGPARASGLHTVPPELDDLLEATWSWLHPSAHAEAATSERAILTLGDGAYPQALLEMSDPPLVLYTQGRPLSDHDSASSIAIVGSRNPTPQGAANARQFAQALGQAGLTIVSGLALGIDGAAHEGALDAVQRGASQVATIAVVGTGLDQVYPKRHQGLARRIAQYGTIVSEYPIGTPPLPPNFPKRNRLIAALSRGTLVVEAALQSGSLITARMAVDAGKDVFAIPGSIHSTQSRGCHALIKQGAKLVESAQDVLEELQWAGAGAAAESPDAGKEDAAEPALLRALGFDPVGLEALLARTGLDTAHLQAQLMALELQGRVARLPGGLFQRVASA